MVGRFVLAMLKILLWHALCIIINCITYSCFPLLWIQVWNGHVSISELGSGVLIRSLWSFYRLLSTEIIATLLQPEDNFVPLGNTFHEDSTESCICQLVAMETRITTNIKLLHSVHNVTAVVVLLMLLLLCFFPNIIFFI